MGRLAELTAQRHIAFMDAREADFIETAACMMRGEQAKTNPLRFTETPDVVKVLKTAVAGGVTTGTDWAGGLTEFGEMAAGFIASLSNVSAFDAMRADMLPAVLRTPVGVVVMNATGSEVDESRARPVTKMTVDNARVMERSADSLVVLSNDVLRMGGPMVTALLQRALRLGVGSATDSIFVTALLAAATSVSPSGAVDALGVRFDLRHALDAVPTGDDSRLHIVMGSAVAKRLTVMATSLGARAFPGMTPRGGELDGMPVHVSDAAGANVLIQDAAALMAASDEIEITASRHAAIQMDTAPTNTPASISASPPTPVGAQLTSLWQSNSTALMARRVFGFEAIRAGGAKLANVQWGLAGSPLA